MNCNELVLVTLVELYVAGAAVFKVIFVDAGLAEAEPDKLAVKEGVTKKKSVF